MGQAPTDEIKPKDLKFIKVYIETGDQCEAAVAAGSKAKTPEALSVVASRMRKRLDGDIKKYMALAEMDALGILRKIKLGMSAKRTNVAFDKDGNALTYESPDWQSRARFTDMAIKLRGGYPKAQLELPFQVGEDGKLVITAEFDTNTSKEMAA